MRESQHGFVDDEGAHPTLVRFFADSRAQSHSGLISAMGKSGKLVTGGASRDLKRSPKDTPLLRFGGIPMRQALKDR